MSPELIALCGTAASLGFIHTLIGPDHYVPFIAMSQAREWSRFKTFVVTFLCGLGHVLSSVILGGLGIGLGWALGWLEETEGTRGDIAAWLLTAFGLLYMVWGIRRAVLNKTHSHSHEELSKKRTITPWVLFTIFAFGPCEPLIPLLMFPAAQESTFGVAMVAMIFSATTIATMMTMVFVGTFGLSKLPSGKLHRYSHALAGASIFVCGALIHIGL